MSLWIRYLAGLLAVAAALDTLRAALGAGPTLGPLLYASSHPALAQLALLALAAALGLVAFRKPQGPWARRALLGLLGALALLSVSDALSVASLRSAGHIGSRWPMPFSALVAALPLVAAVELRRPRTSGPWPRRAHLGALAAAAAALLGAEVVYIHAFGLTDYRRPADVIVVLGAKVHEDGTPSEAVAERVATGVQLYKQGLGPRLLVSGGVGREGQDEAAAMKRIAIRLGVPAEAIVEDNQGNNTEASLLHTRDWLGSRGGRALVVSHYHHLPRVKLLAQRHGVACYTVPADEGATLLRGTPFYVAREAAALAYYYLRG